MGNKVQEVVPHMDVPRGLSEVDGSNTQISGRIGTLLNTKNDLSLMTSQNLGNQLRRNLLISLPI